MIAATTQVPLPWPVTAFLLFVTSIGLIGLDRVIAKFGVGPGIGASLNVRRRRAVWLGFFVVVILLGHLSITAAFAVIFVVGFFAVSEAMLQSMRWSAKDFREATTLTDKMSAFFGWTHSGKVAIGDRKVNLSFLFGLAAHGMLAAFCLMALLGVTSNA
ncbi:MAG: hypothetical protein AAF092_15185 [Pseudomonadota bacterium]